jgi:hypothetical protein
LVGKGPAQRLKEVLKTSQTVVATSSKEGIIASIKTALKLAGDVFCYDFARYGLVRDEDANGVAYQVCPEATTTGTTSVSDTEDAAGAEEDDSSSDEEDADVRSAIPLSDVADACRSWTDHAVRYSPLASSSD